MSLHTQNPRHTGWSGTIKTDMEIGQCALVEIEATFDDGDMMEITVMYRGVDIADTLNDAGQKEIDAHIARHWVQLVREAESEWAADMAEAA